MAFFFISLQDGTVLQMDSTSEVMRSISGTVTTHPIESGDTVADHYINDQQTVSFSGVITDVKALSNPQNLESTDDFLTKIQDLKESAELFDVYSGDITTTKNIVKNCLFTSISIRQDKERGIAKRRIKSYAINFSVVQVKLAELAQNATLKAPAIEVQKEVVEEKKTDTTPKQLRLFGVPVFNPDTTGFNIETPEV